MAPVAHSPRSGSLPRRTEPRPAVSDLGPNDRVQLYPSFATYDDATQQWYLRVRGAVFQPGPHDVRGYWVVRIFERFLQPVPATGEQLNFEERMRGFLRRDQRGRRLAMRIGPLQVGLQQKSLRNGHFAETLAIDADLVQSLAESAAGGQRWLPWGVVDRDGQLAATGRAVLLSPQGTSVISDIDDTIKVTEVTRPTALLANTFLRPFVPIPDMADCYRRWAAQGAAFHYVSSSPDHLFNDLNELLNRHGFPAGSYHLTPVGSKNPSLYGVLHFLWDFYQLRRRAKFDAGCALLRACPGRRFVLVGDSGERDLEMYAELARAFPEQVARIFLRVLPERPIDAFRLQAALAGLPGDLLHAFHDANELPRAL